MRIIKTNKFKVLKRLYCYYNKISEIKILEKV